MGCGLLNPRIACHTLGFNSGQFATTSDLDFRALREFVGLWSGWLVVGFMLGGVLGRRSFGGL